MTEDETTEVLLKKPDGSFISVQDLCDTLSYLDPCARVYLSAPEDDAILVEIAVIKGKIFLCGGKIPDTKEASGGLG